MESLDQDNASNARMWRIYAGGWIAYLLLLSVAVQLDELRFGRFNSRVLVDLVWGVPDAVTLALLWPLSGWIVKKRMSLTRAALVHIACGLAFAGFSFVSLLIRFGGQPASWYFWPVLYGTMMYALTATVFHMVRVNRARRRQQAAIERAHGLLVESELNALRGKLNPHFLFNTLHSIIALTRKDPGAAETALFQFSDMLRYVLDTEKNGSARVTLDEEIGFVRDYLELEALRLGSRLSVDWELDDTAGQHAMPALSLQPLVENSIKHAFNPHSRPGRMVIRTRVDAAARALSITVNDNGPGAEPSAVRGSRGLGIRTVERRLQLEYGEACALKIDTAPGAGFSVTMAIPLAA